MAQYGIELLTAEPKADIYWPGLHYAKFYFGSKLRTKSTKFLKKFFEKHGINDYVNVKEIFEEADVNVTLAFDAASFKETKGETILQKIFEMNYIDLNKVYNHLFFCLIQPININAKPFPIHITLKENGASSIKNFSIIQNNQLNFRNNL